ncbi:MAG TPA: ACT domain-containing protein, partial [Microbacteriaceae bacterium]|nr:ACT domain-containing protein [Microbacteriaceae bacterium]
MTARASRPVLVVHGTDGPGIVAAVTSVLADFQANIVSLDQYSSDPVGGQFFQRTEFNVPDFIAIKPQLEAALAETIGQRLGLTWTLSDISVPKRVAILASLTDHNLLDLLWRQRRGEINMTVPMVVSNHTVVAEDVRGFGVPFFHVHSQGPDKSQAEAEILALLKGNVD